MSRAVARGPLGLAQKVGLSALKKERLKRTLTALRGEILHRTGIEAFRAPALRPASARTEGGEPPFMWRTAMIDGVAKAAATDERRGRAVAHVLAAADAALQGPDYSVVDKRLTPPGGDKHDYYTGGAYWWPAEGAPDGVPWTYRDGHMYPGRFGDDYDLTRLDDFAEAVKMLGLAYRYSGEPAYAARAAGLIRTWFLDPERMMRPHLAWAQRIPGKRRISGSGIIETLRFVYVIDAVGLIAPSGALSEGEVDRLREWFVEYAHWMRVSSNGVMERATNNNHGLSWDIQQMSYALFTGDTARARAVAEELPKRRVFRQIMPDGSLPEELRRKEAFFYIAYGIGFFFDTATLAENVGVDLWRYRTRGGAGVEPAVRDLLRYADGGSPWRKGGTRVPGPELYALALRGAWAYDDPGLAEVARRYEPDLPLQPVDWTVAPYPIR